MRGLQSSIRTAVLVSALLLPWLIASAAAAPHTKDGELIIKFKAGASQKEIDRIRKDLHATRIRGFGRIHAEHERKRAL
jgi:hypothetical protein